MPMSEMSSNREILSVSDLTRSAKRLLEGEFPMVFVEGEISNFSTPASGHWYFTLKDDRAQLRCAMFKNRNRLLRFVPGNGLQVIVRGRISLYEGRGEFQMIAEFMEEAGDGALRRSFEKLKAQLQSEGLFEKERKRQLPALCQRLAIITSPTGAAVRDVLHVLKRRFPSMAVSIVPVQVQGEESVQQIVDALSFVNRQSDQAFDAILLTRGGGSLEDLWSFNTEPVARAIFDSDLPVVTGVGHDTDVTIADFVADIHAPTPSAAAELISPDAESLLVTISQIERILIRTNSNQRQQLSERLNHLWRRLRHPGQRLQDLHQRLDDLEARLTAGFRHGLAGLDLDATYRRLLIAMNTRLERHQSDLNLLQTRFVSPRQTIDQHSGSLQRINKRLIELVRQSTSLAGYNLSHLTTRLDGASPLRIMESGYSIISREGEVMKSTDSLEIGDGIVARLHQGSFEAEVTKIDEDE